MNRRRKYFLKQKMLGLGLALVSLVAGFLMGDLTICVVLVPLGLGLVFTRKMVVVDEYFLEIEERRERRRRS